MTYNKAALTKPNEWFQILVIFSASIPSFICGVLSSWPSPSIPIVISENYPIEITLEEASYFTVIPPIVSAIFGIFFSRIINIIGRKYSFLFVAIPQFVSLILIAFSGSLHVFYLARVFGGIGDACIYTIMPAYVAEICTPKVRGTWGNSMSFLLYVGQLLMNVLGSYCTIKVTALTFSIFPVIFFVSFLIAPESPYYFIMKGQKLDAINSLKRLLQKTNVEEELKQLQSDVARQISESGNFMDLFLIGSNRRAVLVSIFIRASQIFSGISAFSVYTKLIFELAGTGLSATSASILFTVSLVAMNLFAACVLDRLGRRLVMIISCLGCAVSLTVEGVYFYLDSWTDIDLTVIEWFPVFWMLAYVVFFSVGLGIIPTLMLGEIFSTSIKGHALCFMNIIFCLLVGASTKFFQYLMSLYGLYFPFLFFAGCCYISTVMAIYVVPETKGKTLEEIQQELKGNIKHK